MTVHLRNWHRYQKTGIASALRGRRKRATAATAKGREPSPLDGSLSLSYVSVSATLERERHLLERLGAGPNADACLLRLFQYVCRSDALRGEIHVPRASFGPRVLDVPAARGRKVYDALLHEDVQVLVEGPAILPPWVAAQLVPIAGQEPVANANETSPLARARSDSDTDTDDSPQPPAGGNGFAALAPAAARDIVLRWAKRDSKGRPTVHTERAKGYLRDGVENRPNTDWRMRLEWIAERDPSGFDHAMRAHRKSYRPPPRETDRGVISASSRSGTATRSWASRSTSRS